MHSALAAPLIKVAVVDTGLDLKDPRFTPHLCKSGHKDFTGDGIEDFIGHGTHVTGLIVQYAKDAHYCLMIMKYYNEINDGSPSARALKYAVDMGADVINFSASGEVAEAFEYHLIGTHPKVVFIVAAGNESYNLDNPNTRRYPACYDLPNIITVGNGTSAIDRSESSNYGSFVNAWEEGREVLSTLPHGEWGIKSGSSMSCAVRTGKWVYEHSH